MAAVGKSTLAEQYRDKGYEVLSGDAAIERAMKKYGLSSYDEAYGSHRDEIVADLDAQLSALLAEGKDFVSDALNTSPARRARHLAPAKQSDKNYYCEAIILHPPLPQEYAKRLAERKLSGRLRSNDEGFRQRLEDEFVRPSEAEGYDIIHEIGVPLKGHGLL